MEYGGRRAVVGLWASLIAHGLAFLFLWKVPSPLPTVWFDDSHVIEVEYRTASARAPQGKPPPLVPAPAQADHPADAHQQQGAAPEAVTGSAPVIGRRPAKRAGSKSRAVAPLDGSGPRTASLKPARAEGGSAGVRPRQPAGTEEAGPLPAGDRAKADETVDQQGGGARPPEAPSGDTGSAVATGGIGLSPRAAAAGWLAAQRAACEPPADAVCQVDDEADSDTPQVRLQAHLDEVAGTVPHVSDRPPPELRRDIRGDYHFESAAIRAVIHHDGTFAFEDKIGGVAPIPLGGSFDITFFVEKHILGKTIFAAEKAWFLDETADLRARLAHAARTDRLRGGQRALRGRLIAIIEDPARSPSDKRSAVFATWDTCSQDEIGTRGQRVIEALIRERMPQDSQLGFSEVELAALNARRTSVRSFDPYRSTDAGMPPG